jgi:hypothetical protein
LSESETKKRRRFQKTGSTHYEDDKRKLMLRARTGLLLTMEALTRKLEAKMPLRDEEVRFIKNFSTTLAALEMREQGAEKSEGEGLPPGKLREYIERVFQFKESTGFFDTRKDGLSVMEKAQYSLCDYCYEFHKVPDPCPFKTVAEERRLRILAEEAKKEPVVDLTSSG